MEEKNILLIDMYGVIIKEGKGYFIPYTFNHFDKTKHERLARLFWEENLFTKAGNGDLSSDRFLSMLGYQNPSETMQDYLKNFPPVRLNFFSFHKQPSFYIHYTISIICIIIQNIGFI